MTAPIIYDSNCGVQLVPSHKHRPDPDSLAGDEVVCAVCGSRLEIICPNGHAGALDTIRYSDGPVPRAPRSIEKMQKLRQCRDCPTTLPAGSRKRLCDSCQSKGASKKKFCRVLPNGKKKCTGPCGLERPLSEFYAGQSRCKGCFNLTYGKKKSAEGASDAA